MKLEYRNSFLATLLGWSVEPFVGMGLRHPISILLLSAILLASISQNEAANGELTPPYFNLAEGRKITASSTCGVGIEGRELYCKLVGSHTDDQQNNTLLELSGEAYFPSTISRSPGHVVIQGQVCVYFCEDDEKEEKRVIETGSHYSREQETEKLKYFLILSSLFHSNVITAQPKVIQLRMQSMEQKSGGNHLLYLEA